MLSTEKLKLPLLLGDTDPFFEVDDTFLQYSRFKDLGHG